jgi:CRISPR-associated exonuclease Cas4
MYPESDLLPLSALQHLLFCDRQCALIHVEQLWAENALTVQGRHLHEKADAGKANTRGDLRTARGLPLRSLRLGLIGKADVVEFRPAPTPTPAHVPPPPTVAAHAGLGASSDDPDSTTEPAATVPPAMPFPVEYKRGKPKAHDADRVQLCAQALCLEEMLGVAVPAGALFYGKTRRRLDVPFDPALRDLTERTAARLHDMIAAGRTPPPVYEEKKCGRCSLINLCLPNGVGGKSATAYLKRALHSALHDPVPVDNERGGQK